MQLYIIRYIVDFLINVYIHKLFKAKQCCHLFTKLQIVEFICQRICIRKQAAAKAAYVYESTSVNNTYTSTG